MSRKEAIPQVSSSGDYLKKRAEMYFPNSRCLVTFKNDEFTIVIRIHKKQETLKIPASLEAFHNGMYSIKQKWINEGIL